MSCVKNKTRSDKCSLLYVGTRRWQLLAASSKCLVGEVNYFTISQGKCVTFGGLRKSETVLARSGSD